MKKFLLLILFLCMGFFFGISQETINWQTGNGDPTATGLNNTMNATTDGVCVTVNSLTRGTGINEASGNDFNSNGFDTSNASCSDAITDDDCLTWGLSLSSGCTIPAGSVLEFQLDRSNSGPPNFCLDIDTGSGFNSLTTGTISASTGCVSQILPNDIVGPTTVTFRLCAWGASSSLGTMDIEDGIASCGGADGGISLTTTSPLPVELTTFYSTSNNKSVNLFWATATELNNSHFDIEYSVDGTNFRAIGEVIGNGTTQLKQEYSYTHTAPVMGLNYYRLKQVDFDGAFEYSDIRVVEIKRSGKIVINPSAAYSEITVELAETIGENNVIGIYDMMGRTVMMSNFDGTLNVKTIDISNLHKGYYVVRVQAGGEVFTERFMKMVD